MTGQPACFSIAERAAQRRSGWVAMDEAEEHIIRALVRGEINVQQAFGRILK